MQFIFFRENNFSSQMKMVLTFKHIAETKFSYFFILNDLYIFNKMNKLLYRKKTAAYFWNIKVNFPSFCIKNLDNLINSFNLFVYYKYNKNCTAVIVKIIFKSCGEDKWRWWKYMKSLNSTFNWVSETWNSAELNLQ